MGGHVKVRFYTTEFSTLTVILGSEFSSLTTFTKQILEHNWLTLVIISIDLFIQPFTPVIGFSFVLWAWCQNKIGKGNYMLCCWFSFIYQSLKQCWNWGHFLVPSGSKRLHSPFSHNLQTSDELGFTLWLHFILRDQYLIWEFQHCTCVMEFTYHYIMNAWHWSQRCILN